MYLKFRLAVEISELNKQFLGQLHSCIFCRSYSITISHHHNDPPTILINIFRCCRLPPFRIPVPPFGRPLFPSLLSVSYPLIFSIPPQPIYVPSSAQFWKFPHFFRSSPSGPSRYYYVISPTICLSRSAKHAIKSPCAGINFPGGHSEQRYVAVYNVLNKSKPEQIRSSFCLKKN